MGANQSKFSLLPDLNMPIRDALRGVFSLADATEEMLEPAAELLPEPLRSRFRHAMQALEQAGKRLIHAPVDTGTIAAAARFLTAPTPAAGDVAATASVIVYAWEHLHQSGTDHRTLISETIVADRLSRLRSNAPPHGLAAAVLLDLRHSPAIGQMPGLARTVPDKDAATRDLPLIAMGVWLLATRAPTLGEEEKLLDLAVALVRALLPDATAALASPDSLAAFLTDTSAHL